jgi:hypothetical protein
MKRLATTAAVASTSAASSSARWNPLM